MILDSVLGCPKPNRTNGRIPGTVDGSKLNIFGVANECIAEGVKTPPSLSPPGLNLTAADGFDSQLEVEAKEGEEQLIRKILVEAEAKEEDDKGVGRTELQGAGAKGSQPLVPHTPTNTPPGSPPGSSSPPTPDHGLYIEWSLPGLSDMFNEIFKSKYNPSQLRAIKSGVLNQGLTLIQGPPGTGMEFHTNLDH